MFDLTTILAALGVLFIGLSKAGFGGGLGILTTPICVLAFGAQLRKPAFAIGVILPLLCAGDAFSLYHYWGKWERKNLRFLLPGTIVGIVVGVGQFREDKIPRVKYAARDAEVTATYLKSIGGIPHARVRTLIDRHALKSDVAEVLEEWLPKQVDLSTVVYVSVTGRGVVDPTTGAVSLMLFDSTAASGARLYSLRRLQESLAKLPIERAVVMIDLSLEPASGAAATAMLTPLWEQEGAVKDKIMWMVGNRTVQESHSYDPGRHGLFAYQWLKGLGGAADLDKDGTILAGELCTYTKGQVIKLSQEQYGAEQEPLCIPGPGQGAMVRLQPLARFN